MSESAFYILSGLWATVLVVIFIKAIRLSYRIEARSPDLLNRTGLPMRAQLFHTATNYKVARDAETQSLRRRMNVLLLISLVGLVGMAVGLSLFKPHA